MTGLRSEPSTRMPELDGLRGLAILCVMLSHGVGVTGIFHYRSITDRFFAFFMVPLWGGVDLFFVLSGFLITGILLRTKTQRNYFSYFYIRRMLRIFPIYYLALVSSLVAGHFSLSVARSLPPSNSWRAAFFVYLQNWPVFWHDEKIMGGIWGAYWSLAVEEQFYLIWPIVVLLLSEKWLMRVCCLGMVCALPLRLFLAQHYFGDSFGLAQITSSRVDGLFAGAAIAAYMRHFQRPLPAQLVAILGASGLSILTYIGIHMPTEFFATGRWMTTFGISGFALVSAALVASSQHRELAIHRVLSLGLLQRFGKYSYGIYVYHLLLFLPIRWYLWDGWGSSIRLSFPEKLACLFLEIMIIFLLAKLSYELFEVKFLNLKRYFAPGDVANPDAATMHRVVD